MQNMVRPQSSFQKTIPPYIVSAIKMDKGHVDSLVKRMIPFADQIQLVHLKLQQVISKMIPDGVFIDADGLNSVDLGNGASYNPSEALSMYFQTGSVIGRSYTEDGEFNNARVPIQELTSSGSNAKINSLITMYNYQLNLIRAVTGINEARDGSMPDSRALVGVQKLAALNSNTATKHVMTSGLNISRRLCEAISCRISDILQYSDFAEDFAKMIGKNNMDVLVEMETMHLHEFGIFIELEPDEEEKQRLEQNIQQALQAKMIDLADAIDVREIKNNSLANQLLKIRKHKKDKLDRAKQKENIELQSQANQQAAQSASQGRMQETQAKTQSEAQLIQLKADLEMQKLQAEQQMQAQMMQMKFEFEMKLKKLESEGMTGRDSLKEDRKDKRTELQASQQSQLISQRKQGLPAKDFTTPTGNSLQIAGQQKGGVIGGVKQFTKQPPAPPSMSLAGGSTPPMGAEQPPQQPPQQQGGGGQQEAMMQQLMQQMGG